MGKRKFKMRFRGQVFLSVEEHSAQEQMRTHVIEINFERGIQERFSIRQSVLVETQSSVIVEKREVLSVKFKRLSEQFSRLRTLGDLRLRIGDPVQSFGEESFIFLRSHPPAPPSPHRACPPVT